MKIIGFNFTKINVEKFSQKAKDLKVNTKIDVSDIDSVNSDIFKGDEGILGVKFTHIINYDPDFAKIEFAGSVIVSLNSKKAKEVLKQWKDKTMPDDFKVFIFNFILRKSSLKALQLEEEVNLPLHIKFPQLGLKEPTQN